MGAGRGREPFVPVPWDKALHLVAGEIDRVRREHGNSAIMGGSQGWSSAGTFHEARGQLHRFLAAAGGYVDQTMNYSFGAALAFLPHVIGSPQAVVGPLTSWSSIARHGKLMVLFGGANPKNTQVMKGGCAAHSTDHWLREVARAGVRMVNVSPVREDGPEIVNPEWIPIRPNTDAAILLALTHTLVSENLHDQRFLTSHCIGFERVVPYLMGETDGQRKDADWAAPITGVPAHTIRRLARDMAATRTMVTASWSLQRAHHGEQPYWAVVLLASALGQIGLPGGGFGFGYGSAGGIADPPLMFARAHDGRHQQSGRIAIPAARISDCLLHPGETFDFNGKQGTYPDIRFVYWAGGNPFHHHQDINKLRRAWERPETIVVHDPWWTATARHADIVLPATTSLERNDIGCARRDRFIMAMQRAIEPVGEARSDFAIFSALARRLGCADAYTKGRDEIAWLRLLYEQCRAGRRQCDDVAGFRYVLEQRLAGDSSRLRRVRAVQRVPRRSREEPAAHAESGRIELYSERSQDLATTIARPIRRGSSRPNGWDRNWQRITHCILFRASRATACIVRWIPAQSAPAARSLAARRSRSIQWMRKCEESTTATWCACSMRAVPAWPAPSSPTR